MKKSEPKTKKLVPPKSQRDIEQKRKLKEVIKSIGQTEKLMQMIQSPNDYDPIQEGLDALLKVAKLLQEQRDKELKNSKKNKTKPQFDELLKVEEVAKITKESKQITYRRIRKGEIKSIKLTKVKQKKGGRVSDSSDRQIRVWYSDLMEFLNKKRFDLI